METAAGVISPYSPLRTHLRHLLQDTATHWRPHCSITAILISRFLLELQEANRTVVRVDADDPLHFANNPYDDTPSFIRSLGAVISSGPLSHDDEGDVDSHSQLCSEAHPSRGEKSAFESSEMAVSELVPSHSLPGPLPASH